jgi:hypothetical protein
MRNVIIGSGSFVLGMVFASVLGFGNPHTSTIRHFFGLPSALAQSTPPSPPKPAPLSPFVPRFPAVGIESSQNRHARGEVIDFDGVASDGEIFQDVTLRYGGGAFLLRNATVEGNIKLEVFGAARNTVALLAILHLLGCPATAPKMPPIAPNTPMLNTASLKEPLTGTFESPYGSEK